MMEDILHAETCSGSSTERNDVFAQLGLVRLEPSVWLEGAGVGEVGWVIVEHDGGHAYGRLKKVPRVSISAGVVAVINATGNEPNVRSSGLTIPCTAGRYRERFVVADERLHNSI